MNPNFERAKWRLEKYPSPLLALIIAINLSSCANQKSGEIDARKERSIEGKKIKNKK